MTVTAITSIDQFREVINRDKVVIIDFLATWCGSCRVMSPIFEQFSNQYSDPEFYKVDVDDQEAISEEAGITAMPTFIAFKAGKMLDELVGAVPQQLEALIAKHAT
ncbi:hypothetical protein FRC04_004998 [Tulasnella sp. 424]|nr:hypothetical protein FRC04_004998 [Tulasnella sp. 424]KAG8962538.1 hypothetical protein FRC05_005301 [Tulasnella sp. 425]